ncbi:hypothetical protein FXB41_28725 [Bradyrhizobium canariense]|uniref:hypothetical protein n=1 Tax=Bradyrhizobium canariense TaxID=255045 RepID=UPI001CA5184E|nr:hypothetical protein [Bradyrhizobium canariense]MBW5438604.1 hypothetical protein [Bradyrhizobium canariense]
MVLSHLSRLVVDHCRLKVLAGAEMPRIPPQLLDATFYLYRSVEEAKAGKQAGGTGAFVSVPIPEMPGRAVVYAVSNKHVVMKLGCSVIRVNTLIGGTDAFEKDPGVVPAWRLEKLLNSVPVKRERQAIVSSEMAQSAAPVSPSGGY